MQACDENTTGRVHSLETFGLVDGPGVRFVAFLQGCGLRCRYCHNPETWGCNAGEEWTAGDLFKRACRYRSYWGKKGGITVSGGEPLLQAGFVAALFKLAHEHGVNTALDTAGAPYREDADYLAGLDELLQYTDLVMLDLKIFDEQKHRELTGQGNSNILAFARHLAAKGIPMWIRHVLVPGLTDDEQDLRAMDEFIRSLGTVTRVEVLPYHTLGLFKWEQLGIPYTLQNAAPPTEAEIKKAEAILHTAEYK